MQISGVLTAGHFVSTALGWLGTRNEPAEAAGSKPSQTSATQPERAAGTTAAFREILACHDVTDISPRQFSEMIHKLHKAGTLTDQEFQELSMIRIDLDLEGVDPDEHLNLVDFYLSKLRELHRDRADLRDPVDSLSADRPAAVTAAERRLQWLQKFALIQSTADSTGMDTLI